MNIWLRSYKLSDFSDIAGVPEAETHILWAQIERFILYLKLFTLLMPNLD